MAEDAAGAVVQVLVQNLISLVSDEIKLVRGFEKDFAKLKDSLNLIQKLLSDAEKKEFQDEAVKVWLKQLEDVAFEADAVCDEFNYHLLRQEVKNRNPETKKVSCSFSSSGSTTSLLFRRKMAQKIREVYQNFTRIYESPVAKGLQEIVVSSHDGNTAGSMETDSFKIESIVGRDNDVAKVVQRLLDAPRDNTFSVISIVGMGGLGKTTLTRKIFNHEKINSQFGLKLWVSVSFDFNEISLFKKILEILTKENVKDILTKEVVLQKIGEELKRKSQTYLLVLDDVWNEDSEKWKGFASSLLGISNGNGNAILVTTRKVNVPSVMESYFTLPLSKLSEGECWSIITARALIEENVHVEFGIKEEDIAKRCGGLPLAANVLGSLLCGKPIDEWSSFLEKELPNFGQEENQVRKILKLSYDQLPSSSLKRCFSYCSVFPQDSTIYKEGLIELWMAEGLLNAKERGDMEILGNKYFNILLHNSLFQDVVQDEFGNIICCGMHDLVHDLACSISGSNRVRDGGNDRKTIRYLYQVSDEPPYSKSKEEAKYVRTLVHNGKVPENFFQGLNHLHALKLENPSVEALPEEIGKQIHLRFLDISGTRIKCLPYSINKLSNLQTLVVPRCLEKLPNTISDLFNMRHLHIDSFKELPPRIGKLTSLQTLPYYKVGQDEGCRIGELGKLKNLKGKVEIGNLERVSNREEAEQAYLFGKPNIVQLTLGWSSSREDDGRNDENVLEGLQPHPNLKCLKIKGYGSKQFPSWTMKMAVNGDMGLTKLTRIELRDCGQCEEIPSLGHLPNLKFLVMHGLHNVESIGLSFYGLEQQCSSSSSSNSNLGKQQQVQETKAAFPALERLELKNMSKLKEWVDVHMKVTAFPCLEYLEIDSCPKLKSIPNHFVCLKELKVKEVDVDFPLTNVVCSNTSSIQTLKIDALPGLVLLSGENHTMEKLEIENCPKLESISIRYPSLRLLTVKYCPEVTHLSNESRTCSLQMLRLDSLDKLESISIRCPSLRHLSFFKCPEVTNLSSELLESCTSSLQTLCLSGLDKLESISLSHPSLQQLDITDCKQLTHLSTLMRSPSLRHLRISYCPEFTHLPSELLESSTSSLQQLTLWRLENLRMNLGSVIPYISRMSNLVELNLSELPKVERMDFDTETITQNNNASCLSRLQKLWIGGFSESWDLVSFNNLLHAIVLRPHYQNNSLTELSLCGQENWESLPDQIQHLKGLKLLWFKDGGRIEALPEWIGKLTSLEELIILNCESLSEMPSKEAMQRLTRLSELAIQGCPVIAEKWRRSLSGCATAADDSEWLKVSHIDKEKICLDCSPLPDKSSPPIEAENKFTCCLPFPTNRRQ